MLAMNWRTLGAIGLVVIGVGAVGLTLFGPTLARGDGGEDYLTATAAVSDVIDEAVADGTISATATYGLTFGADPHIISDGESSNGGSGTWLVEVVNVTIGEHVSAGDVLATADTTDAEATLELAQANLEAAQARYDSDAAGASSTDRQAAQLSIDQAEQNLANAEQSRDDTERENRIRLDQAKDDVNRARTELRDHRDADAPDEVIDQDKDALRQARDSLSLLEVQIEAQNRQARDQVESAELALDSAHNEYDSRTASVSDETLASDRAAVLQAEQAVVDAQAQIEAAALVAPIDGVVVAVDLVPGTTAPSTDAIQLMAAQMLVTADFAEADLSSLELGQPAMVTVSATGDAIEGTVSQIDPVAASAAAGSVVSFAVTIDLGDVPDGVKPGMSAEVAVTIAEASDVVAVPSTALVGGAGSYTVRVLDGDGNVGTRPVQVGLVTSSLTEIVSGVTAGEQVVVGTTSSLTTTTGNGFPGGGAIPGGGGFRQVVREP
jgi:RND family efflux transporter MFP subunit